VQPASTLPKPPTGTAEERLIGGHKMPVVDAESGPFLLLGEVPIRIRYPTFPSVVVDGRVGAGVEDFVIVVHSVAVCVRSDRVRLIDITLIVV